VQEMNRFTYRVAKAQVDMKLITPPFVGPTVDISLCGLDCLESDNSHLSSAAWSFSRGYILIIHYSLLLRIRFMCIKPARLCHA